MLVKGRAPRAPRREQQKANRGGRGPAALAPPPVAGPASRPHFRRASVCRRRCRKSGRRFAASRKMAAAAVNGAAGASSSGPAAASGAVLQAAAGMYEQLKGEWNRKSPNLSKCGEELGRLKVGLRGGAPGVRPRGGRAAHGARVGWGSDGTEGAGQPTCGRGGGTRRARPGAQQRGSATAEGEVKIGGPGWLGWQDPVVGVFLMAGSGRDQVGTEGWTG